jgi:hypothetical protein
MFPKYLYPHTKFYCSGLNDAIVVGSQRLHFVVKHMQLQPTDGWRDPKDTNIKKIGIAQSTVPVGVLKYVQTRTSGTPFLRNHNEPKS